MSITAAPIVEVEELTADQAHKLFDAACRRELSVGADEFLSAYKCGELPAEWSAEAVNRLEMLLPLAD